MKSRYIFASTVRDENQANNTCVCIHLLVQQNNTNVIEDPRIALRPLRRPACRGVDLHHAAMEIDVARPLEVRTIRHMFTLQQHEFRYVWILLAYSHRSLLLCGKIRALFNRMWQGKHGSYN